MASRIGRLVGQHHIFGSDDPHFQARLQETDASGMTRDEIGVWAITGLLSKLDGRIYDLDEAELFVKNIKMRLDIIRAPTLTKRLVRMSVWKIPTNDLLTRFATLPTNLVVIGDRRLTFAYARHEIATYTTGNFTGIFTW